MATSYVYMLRCREGSFYVGSTSTDLSLRVFQHQEGRGSEHTRRRLPVELVWFEEHENILGAFAREKQVQGWGRAKRQALIDGRYADLPALSRRPMSPLGSGFKPRAPKPTWVHERDSG